MNQIKRCRYGDMVFQPNDTYVGRSFDLYGEFSEAEVALFRQLVKPGQVVLDIGANIGAHTVPLAQLTGPTGCVLAFEPQRIPYYSLCANVLLNHLTQVVCHQAAVGDVAGTIAMPEIDYSEVNNFGGLEITKDYGHKRHYPVPLLRIDDLPLDACHFLKIDVEGMETKVLAGAVDTIRRFRPLLCVEDDRFDRSAEVRAFLESLGYELYVHEPPLFNPHNFFQNARNVFGRTISLNLYCHPREVPSPINPLDFRMTRVRQTTEGLKGPSPAPRQQSSEEAVPYHQQAKNLALQGKLDEAIPYFEQALRLNPDYAVAQNDLGNVFYLQRRFAEAVACYERALRLQRDFPVAYNNLGAALIALGRFPEATAHCRSALVFRPDYVEALNNLGIALVQQGQLTEAQSCFHEAVRLKPDYVEAHQNRALVWLLSGDFEQGWPEHEWRDEARQPQLPRITQPLWDGTPLQGRTILLHAEQGLGDTLQFIRYAPLVQQRGGKVLVMAPRTLLPLLASCPGIDSLLAQGSALPAFEVHAPLLSLPWIFKTTLATIPAEVPYLSADAKLVERWRKELDLLPPPPTVCASEEKGRGRRMYKIGIAWQGNPRHKDDRQRSLPLARFEPLARLPGVALYSLQVGPGAEQVRDQVGRFWVTDVGSRFDPASFQDVAAVVTALDLVITVDSAIAHLAGALGMPVWLLLPFAPDWRWLLEREDSLWYPTMRLFRQTEPGDWEGVFRRIGDAVSQQVAEADRR